jgi:small-conductance mechanosensitive channel
MSSVEGRIGEERIPEAIQRHLSSQLDALGKQLDRGLKYQTIILAVDEVEKRLLDEIEKKLGQISIEDHLAGIKENIVDFWNIEIWSVDNKSVTLRKVATALIILAIGMIVAKFILAMIRSRFLLKSQFKDTTASAVHKILSYAAYLLVFLFALRMVNIPLTAFAFLGGAIAIGVGFGAQNLLNNFISGFMILGERPINIGDLIEIDGVVGMVEEIGARCTRVRTGENIHILVPNSAFLERNIINWTLSDKKIRTHITIGVSYGSPVKKVEQKLIEGVNQVQRVLKHPEPFVLFIDFGDNALIFNLYFWIAIKRVIERRQIESAVRFIIDEIFAEEGIIIAFPQRDVHLDTDKPLRITVTD